mgnify:CR=1 FL=1
MKNAKDKNENVKKILRKLRLNNPLFNPYKIIVYTNPKIKNRLLTIATKNIEAIKNDMIIKLFFLFTIK